MKSLQLSFAAGEVSPEMAGRIDARQYQSGAAKVLNFLPLPQGPVKRRTGSRHVARQYATDDRQVWLIPFVYSTDESIVVELSEGIIRFAQNGELLRYADPIDIGTDGFDTTANTITFIAEHGLTDNEQIVLVPFPTSGVLPTGLAVATTYYVIVVDSYTIQVSLSSGPGAAVSMSGSPTGYTWAYRKAGFPADWASGTDYLKGDLFYWDGSVGSLAAGVFRAQEDHQADLGGDPDTDYLASNIGSQPAEGTLTVGTQYLATEHPSIHYAQSNDVLTLVHPNHPPRELRRLLRDGEIVWDLREINFGSTVAAPVAEVGPTDRGTFLKIVSRRQGGSVTVPGSPGATFALFRAMGAIGLSGGDPVYIDVESIGYVLVNSGQYIVNSIVGVDEFTLRTVQGLPLLHTSVAQIAVANVYYSSLSGDDSQTYKVTSLDLNGIESTPSDAVTFTNNLDVAGATNTITWPKVEGAARYRVYKETNGLYGYIGEADQPEGASQTFTDDNIAPDLGTTPPIADLDLSDEDYPRAVGYFEQRRCFGGTVAKPRQLWMTKSGTESDLTYSLPQQDDDRISVALAAREATTIRHIVSMSDMLLLAQSSEWRLTSVNSDAITPDSVAVRQQSEIGCNDVRPVVVNNVVVFAANRGGHVRTMAFNFQAQGYVTSDLSLRASHLFDGLTIADSTYSKAPYPVLWFVSSSGNLLSLTYVPEEEVFGWAEHDLGGTVESVCSIPEGDQDSLYVSVKRDINGTSYRYLERIVPEVTESLEDFPYVDASVTYDGTETDGRTVTVTGRTWGEGDKVTATVSAHVFKDASVVGGSLELRDAAGVKYRIRITGYTSSTVVTGVLSSALPAAMQQVAIATWSFCRRTVGGLAHLEGESVQIVADGEVQPEQTVASGIVTLDVAAAVAHVGKGYVSDLKTLPIVFQQMQGAGRGKTKNVEKVAMRVLDSAGLTVGPDASNLVPVSSLPATELTTGERRTVVPGKWTDDGEIYIRQDKPLPATILGLAIDITMGD